MLGTHVAAVDEHALRPTDAPLFQPCEAPDVVREPATPVERDRIGHALYEVAVVVVDAARHYLRRFLRMLAM